MPGDIAKEIDALQQMTTSELADRYQQLHGQPVRTRHRAYLIGASCAHDMRGIAIEVFGGGNVPPDVCEAIDESISSGVVVCAVSHCGVGAVSLVARHSDVTILSPLGGLKARLALMMARSSGSLEALRTLDAGSG